MNDRVPWRPITGMPDGAHEWGNPGYLAQVDEWRHQRRLLEDPALDKTIMELWSKENRRLFAVENGQIENLYTLRRGITEELITHGFEGARISHTVASEVSDDKTLSGLLTDQESALEMVFDTVKQIRPLSHSVIREWHALLTRHQESAVGIRNGKRVRIPLLKLTRSGQIIHVDRMASFTNTAHRNMCKVKWIGYWRCTKISGRPVIPLK